MAFLFIANADTVIFIRFGVVMASALLIISTYAGNAGYKKAFFVFLGYRNNLINEMILN